MEIERVSKLLKLIYIVNVCNTYHGVQKLDLFENQIIVIIRFDFLFKVIFICNNMYDLLLQIKHPVALIAGPFHDERRL